MNYISIPELSAYSYCLRNPENCSDAYGYSGAFSTIIKIIKSINKHFLWPYSRIAIPIFIFICSWQHVNCTAIADMICKDEGSCYPICRTNEWNKCDKELIKCILIQFIVPPSWKP